MKNIRYAADTTLITQIEKDLVESLKQVKDASSYTGLKFIGKTLKKQSNNKLNS